MKIVLLAIAAGGVLLAGCHREAAPVVPEAPAKSVRVQSVQRQPLAAIEAVVGTVRPKLSAIIEAKVSGRIIEMLVVPGQIVTNGQSLVRLDAQEIRSRHEQAAAALEQAQNDLKRFAALLEQKILSQSEFDTTQAKYRVAAATEMEARTMLDYTRISAPFGGVITRKHADVGDQAMPGKAILQMENPNALRLEADVPEALIGNVKLGDQLSVRIASVTGDVSGTVAELSPAADANSRTFLVKLNLPNVAGLRSGQFGRVAVPVGEVETIRVLFRAVLLRGQMELIFVVANGRAQMRLVKTGRHVGDDIEIVSGLNPGEQIVVDEVNALVDGQPVNLKP
jgi:RND family efflux transporter MFP subunit